MRSVTDFVDIATRYAEQVIAGEIVACRHTIAACQRQLDDLARVGDDDWPYHFDETAAGKICQFAEELPHVKGEWAKPGPGGRAQRIELTAPDVFFLTTVFGWLRKADGGRRFRKAYRDVARKNAKSTIGAIVALYMLTEEGEPGAEVYSAATKRDQAKIVFGMGQQMARKSSDLRTHYGVQVLANSIVLPSQASKFVPLDAEASTQDGLGASCAIVDELHAHKTGDLLGVLESSTGSRASPLIMMITTAGFNRAGICFAERGYVIKILDRRVTDETVFGIIYTLDENDDPFDPAVWPKANPNLGVSVYDHDIEAQAKEAKASAQKRLTFLTKRCNIWVNAAVAWLDMNAWQRCEDTSLKRADFKGEACRAGLDLATKVDICARVELFVRDGHVYQFGQYYLPEKRLETSVNAAAYRAWADEGYLTITPGEVVDLDMIEADIAGNEDRPGLADEHEVTEVAYDPVQATQMAQHLMRDGVPVVEVRATVLNFSEPMKELEALVLAGRWHHDGNPVMTWMMSNVVAYTDAKDNIYPRKDDPEAKIDGPVAAIMALARVISAGETETSVYAERGVLVL